MRTREESLKIISDAIGGNAYAVNNISQNEQNTASQQNTGMRSREESLRIIQSALGGGSAAGTSPQSATPQSASPTAPLAQGSLVGGGGGTAGGGGGRGGRADVRADLQNRLNGLDEAAAYVTTTEQSDEIERQRRPIIGQLRELDAAEGKTGIYTGGDRLKNALSNAKLIAQQGVTERDHMIAQTADWLFGGVARESRALVNATLQTINPNWGFENEDPLITQYNKRGAEVIAANDAIAQKRIEEGKLSKTAWKYGPEIVGTIPDAVLAFLTYGSSAASQTTTKGLEAASRLAQGGKLYQKLAPIAQSTLNMMRSPQWLSAFARSAGPSYEAALADGASEELASLYALANGWKDATIEVGGAVDELGGIQKLPEQIQTLAKQGDSGFVLPWLKSTGSEVFEEALQGISGRAMRTIYSDDVPVYSNENPNAIINPELMSEEAKEALIISSILGGGQISAEAVRRALRVPAKVDLKNPENGNSAVRPEGGTSFPADPGDLETLNPETSLALNQDWEKPDYSPYVETNSLQNTGQHDTIFSDYPLDRSNIISDGSHIYRGKLKPNCTYTTGEHGYIYVTNGDGLIKYARADDLQLKDHDQRLPHSRNTPGKLAGDEAGHLFGDLFGGSPKLDNLVSQAWEVNRIQYRKIEREWQDALKMNKKVSAEIIIDYEPGSSRPREFTINYSINGEIHSTTIKNTNEGG